MVGAAVGGWQLATLGGLSWSWCQYLHFVQVPTPDRHRCRRLRTGPRPLFGCRQVSAKGVQAAGAPSPRRYPT